ncbi:putative Zn-dependent protease [Spirosoma lacussanchae]|uniref:tetratricopeptide repeat protein n=1 Tax=Spirosoma lacussanchae TaxID=1884249 RepID=UPI00110993F5|nr:tetratricopeptide repeat protein [Spirosoma lacussanchae]
MKSIYFVLMVCFLAFGTRVQAQQQGQGAASVLDQAAMDAVKKDKEKSDKDITDAKASAKASTWMDRAKTYQSIAGQYIRLDSMAATKAQEAYTKVVELDKDKKGGPGRLAKEAQEAMKSQAMYGAFMQQGVAKFQNKNYAEAMKSMIIAGEITPTDTLAPLYTAIAAQQIKDNATAKTQLEKYMTAGGKDATIYGSLAMLYRADNEIDKALATLDKGIAMAPTNKDLSNERINIMLATNRIDEAIEGYKQLVQREPNNAQNIANLGILYDNAANGMQTEIRKLSEETKKGGDISKKLAAQKDALDAINGEITRLTAKVKKEPKNADAKRQLADVTKRQADTKAALAQLETQAKEEAAKSSSTAGNEAKLADLMKKNADQRALAKESYMKALAIDPANYDANFNLGVAYFNDGVEMKKAVDGMDMAEYNKRGKEVDGRVCGKFKQALPYFQKAKSVKEEADLVENLTNLENILKQYEERKIVCVESK